MHRTQGEVPRMHSLRHQRQVPKPQALGQLPAGLARRRTPRLQGDAVGHAENHAKETQAYKRQGPGRRAKTQGALLWASRNSGHFTSCILKSKHESTKLSPLFCAGGRRLGDQRFDDPCLGTNGFGPFFFFGAFFFGAFFFGVSCRWLPRTIYS